MFGEKCIYADLFGADLVNLNGYRVTRNNEKIAFITYSVNYI